ncbi:hypothetical protein C4569_01995 [Candidatus Parcubacteria bacterium]|nr:MAG: hypothetical protein C4569_01995 [Candidatus Parcubacteria bacterium]
MRHLKDFGGSTEVFLALSVGLLFREMRQMRHYKKEFLMSHFDFINSIFDYFIPNKSVRYFIEITAKQLTKIIKYAILLSCTFKKVITQRPTTQGKTI